MNAVLARLSRGGRRIGRGLRRFVRVTGPGPIVVLVVAIAVGVVAWVVLRGGDDEPPGGASMPSYRVGVTDGDSVPGYIADQKTELARLLSQAPDTPVYALVSLTSYRTPAQVTAVAAGNDGVETVAGYARLPLPGQQTELIKLPAQHLPDDLVTAMHETADRKTAQAASYASQAAADPAAHDPTLKAQDTFAADLATREAAAYRSDCACVYALVVRAAPTGLTALAAQPGVRVVDAAPELTDVAYGVFVAPLPEQVATVAPLPDGLDPDANPAPSP